MSIDIDDARFQQIVEATIGRQRLEAREARVVIAIAQLAGSIDLDESSEERTVLDEIIERVCELGGIEPETIRPLSPVPTDDEARAHRLRRMATRLDHPGPRELAYVLANLLIVSDHELAPIESMLLDELARALQIPQARARELLETASRLVTPPELPAPPEQHRAPGP